MNTGKRIYVGNIPFAMAEVHLRDLFSPYGEVYDAHIVTDRDTGKARGFAFVTMETSGADKAMEALSDSEYGGRTLTVNEAKEREKRGGGGPQRRRDQQGRGEYSRR